MHVWCHDNIPQEQEGADHSFWATLWEITILHHLDDAWLLELALEALVAGFELELEDVAAVAGLFFSADLKICSSAVIVVFLVLLHRPSNRPSTCGLLQTILQDWETESPLKTFVLALHLPICRG